ncbi:hypothetical protein RF11_03204 [Thelohanellus kitauei]|uniref:Uncharacterized protein n=1 Tax=Thelohanellus kitauei TaxID=669202 RepID=A0A0C2IUW1_THEKT|nr:hypothetical protein RF11_03204 [Thelohanellus kitauei]
MFTKSPDVKNHFHQYCTIKTLLKNLTRIFIFLQRFNDTELDYCSTVVKENFSSTNLRTRIMATWAFYKVRCEQEKLKIFKYFMSIFMDMRETLEPLCKNPIKFQ